MKVQSGKFFIIRHSGQRKEQTFGLTHSADIIFIFIAITICSHVGCCGEFLTLIFASCYYHSEMENKTNKGLKENISGIR